MPSINLLDLAQQADHHAPLELIRLGGDELPLIPFTTDVVPVKVHYCPEDEVRGYVQCNEADCILCRIGRKQDERYLLPAYLPTLKTVGVLPISPNMQPFALLPQLLEALQVKEARIVVFVRKLEWTKFTVTTAPLAITVDAGEPVIKAFMEKLDAGVVDLRSVFNRLSNSQLAAVAPIAETMRLKGLDPDAIG
jgi:hypothetical protein